MLSKTFNLLSYLKKRGNYLTGKLPIYQRATVNERRIELAANREEEPEICNAASGKAVGMKDGTRSLNAYLVYTAKQSL